MAARRCTFSMWYYVFGVDMGTLKVFQYTPSNDRNYNLMTVVDLGEDAGIGDKWNLYQVQVEACAENFQMSIEAKDNNDYLNNGGYAIDDIRFENCAYTLPLPPGGSCDADSEMCDSGHCFPKTEWCDYTPNCCDGTDESTQNCADHRMCDFETDMCEWGQLTDDTLDWTRKKGGGTGTSYTGPYKDHTTFSSSGYFIYTEATNALPGDSYRIGSFYIQPTSSGCEIRFYHHMRGSGMGTLNLYTRTQIGGPLSRLWYTDTAHGNYWLYQRVELASDAAFQVVFEGIRGSSEQSDMALDDITFTPECIESKNPLPPADVVPTQPNHCPSGLRPCNIDDCIDESNYCDFAYQCEIGHEDEAYCPSTCNFDAVDQTLCYWSQDVNDDFDWSLFTAAEVDDSYKGPRTDHTTGSPSGHYIYVDGTLSSINTFAKLISPIYTKSARGCTFSMYYYMFGIEYGDLEVRLINLEGLDVRLTKVGDDLLDYNKWILSESVIPACTKNFQIVIEAEDRQVVPSEGGFAVDDIAFINCYYSPADPGNCGLVGQSQCDAGECYPVENQCDFTQDCCDMSDEDPQTCNQLGYSMCDFEIDLCDWEQLTTDEFDWRRNKGDTSSEGTGPKVDHTLGTDEGYYIYTEASNPKKLGERARLASFTIAGSRTSRCSMRFFYHMRGTGMGTLTVYTRTQINGPLTPIWSMSRDQGNIWYYQMLEIDSDVDYQIIIEGSIGTTTDGDIALDDISLTPNCAPASESIPAISTVPPSQIACTGGQLPCNMGCIDESSYCDFKHDCLPGQEDELMCPVFCDFESDLCYWTQANDNDIDWTWYNHGEDPLTYNGPDTDHTTGAASGHYIYVDGSISKLDDIAKIISPMYKKSKRGCLFTLWYYMFGIEYGDLEVRLMTGEEDYRLTKANDGASDYGKWQIYVTEIPPCSTNFQVAVESEDRQIVPSEGGFAVDDMLFQDCEYPEAVSPGSCGIGNSQCASGECYPTSQMCDFTPDCCDLTDEQNCGSRGYTMCDFENGLCNWEQLETDEFDWTRRSGPTSSDGTGPSKDHTTGSGYYLYTEASNPRRNGERAKLGSFNIQSTITGQCVIRFFYHMEGIGIGTLNVYTRTSVNGPKTLLWTKERAIGGEWVYQTIPLRSNSDFQVIIEGVIGYTTDSDIGLDDVSFTPDCKQISGTLPVVVTEVNTQPTDRTVSICRSGKVYCSADRKCIDEEVICDGFNDCSDGFDEQSCFKELSGNES
ncbi:MAM and LDL-receptor class A domain-containing protein 2-like [Lytechinus variegatus]|uniref:MAM and LDL-receptor class A domain-containing protein 2-like n=1 Tax=Lytechinus variegatus TaxID=7654 RepID=UPI001BB17A06|nr:MAM and LDL-receptor class A domain-containing protein 2-like [Lytechinus variegatus]